MKLSIVVPVYNVERYIVKCVSSLLCQVTDDYEIIIVNDGTKDKSIELVKTEFDDGKIKIVEQVNAGLSAARNTGVKYATGEYIWFVDSDDWIEPHSVDWICSALKKTNADVLYQSYTYEYINQKVSISEGVFFEGIKSGVELMKLGICPTCAPYYIVKRSFWLKNHFAFYVGILHEDNELMYKILYLAQDVICLDKPVYYYNIRPGSIVQTFNPRRCYSLKIVCTSMCDFLIQKVKREHRYIFAKYIIDAFYAMLDAAKIGDDTVIEDINQYLSLNKKVLTLLWKYGDIKARLFYLACLSSRHKYVQLFALIRNLKKSN